ncbi:YMGG-like glycine zipper-containing protein [Suttonella sp. R2A3]|uniref:glycine zipper 2TM domain-containing protein n=1 Tax=Suttonella sp. R2A3 TaxID=2908648 RepID=UPI001F42664B|nr:YMGG-like glycine zipper-containing protein [Suttonella sp. R2A3]UJF24783.1 YMGG-like glycine zipper-containing protein [Suttonella sp. R2A3]
MNKLWILPCAALLGACATQPPQTNTPLQAQQGLNSQQNYQSYQQASMTAPSNGVGQVYGKPHQLRNAAVGAAFGAAIGQAWGQDTEGTVTGAAIGGLIGSQMNTLY